MFYDIGTPQDRPQIVKTFSKRSCVETATVFPDQQPFDTSQLAFLYNGSSFLAAAVSDPFPAVPC